MEFGELPLLAAFREESDVGYLSELGEESAEISPLVGPLLEERFPEADRDGRRTVDSVEQRERAVSDRREREVLAEGSRPVRLAVKP